MVLRCKFEDKNGEPLIIICFTSRAVYTRCLLYTSLAAYSYSCWSVKVLLRAADAQMLSRILCWFKNVAWSECFCKIAVSICAYCCLQIWHYKWDNHVFRMCSSELLFCISYFISFDLPHFLRWKKWTFLRFFRRMSP